MRHLQTLVAKNSIITHQERDVQTAHMICDVCSKTEDLLLEQWNLSLRPGTQVHIMRSWLLFPFDASSLARKILLAITLPLWAIRARKLWEYSGGWSLPYPRQPAIGVKPPDLLKISDRSMGRRIFIDGIDDLTKVQMITCHELTHASTAHLKLPAWFNEGLAMVTVDKYFGYCTVKSQTLTSLQNTLPKTNPRGYRQLQCADKDTLIYLYIRGYWITRYLEEIHPDILRGILLKRRHNSTIITMLADALHLPDRDFWQDIDDFVLNHFVLI